MPTNSSMKENLYSTRGTPGVNADPAWSKGMTLSALMGSMNTGNGFWESTEDRRHLRCFHAHLGVRSLGLPENDGFLARAPAGTPR
jgi:hypothetical protein